MKTIDEVRALSAQLKADMQALVRTFEEETGCFVHSVPVIQTTPGKPITVDVKVQITEPRA